MCAEKLLDEITDEPYISDCGLVSPKEQLRSYISKLEKERELLIEELVDHLIDGDDCNWLRMSVRKKVLDKIAKKLESDDT